MGAYDKQLTRTGGKNMYSVEQGVSQGDQLRRLIKASFFPTPTPGRRPCLHREGSTRGLANERPEWYVYH
jgi:hypothetical protein